MDLRLMLLLPLRRQMTARCMVLAAAAHLRLALLLLLRLSAALGSRNADHVMCLAGARSWAEAEHALSGAWRAE